MRNLLALLAAFTLSTSTITTAVACGTTNQTTVVVFDWNTIINGEEKSKTSDQFFEYLLQNPDAGIGQSLYKDIVDYVNLSTLKTNSIFNDDYQFAKQSVENQIKNIQDSLKAKYGRSWESQWKNFLKEPEQGGDGKTGSYQRYFDVLLKSKANTIINQYYIGDNYHNYQYYNSTEISIWLNNMYDKIHNKWSMSEYLKNGLYKDKVWIVAKSVNQDDTEQFTKLEKEIKENSSASNIKLTFKIAKTKDDKPLKQGDDYLVDPSNTIKGLLSTRQIKVAQVWMKNQGPIWARQIVIPFNEGDKKNKALQEEINEKSFDSSKTRLKNTIDNITKDGFESALKTDMGSITSVTNSSSTGDLGLVTLNSDTSNIKPSFSYYLYRYVTSSEGIGTRSTTTAPYNLPEYKSNSDDFSSLFEAINRTEITEKTNNQTSKYHDLIWMEDGDKNNKYSGNNKNKIAIFIDSDGIHFVQTPGITYTSTVYNEPLQKIITDYTQLLSNSTKPISWEDVRKLSDRHGGLTNNPYLNFLQTQNLLWNARNETPYFNLNDSLNKFTSGSNDIASDIWWDFILYFNNNINNIHWNLPTLLNYDVDAPSDKIYQFIKLMKTWFLTTFQRRWNLHQGITSTETLIKNINDLNKTWDDYGPDAPVARLDATDIKNYLNNVASQTIWWYDPNSIQG